MKSSLTVLVVVLIGSSVHAQAKPGSVPSQTTTQKVILEQSKLIANLTMRVYALEQQLQKLEVAKQSEILGTVYAKCATGEREIHSSFTYSSETITKVSCGTPLTAFGKESGYYKVRTSDGAVGYIMADYVSTSKPISSSDLSAVKTQLDQFNCDAEFNRAATLAALERNGGDPNRYMGAAAMTCTQRLVKIVQAAVTALEKQE